MYVQGDFMSLEITLDNPIGRDKVSMCIRPNKRGLKVNVESEGRGLLDVSELAERGNVLGGGTIGQIRSVNVIIQGGDAGPELVKVLRSTADQLDHELKNQSAPK